MSRLVRVELLCKADANAFAVSLPILFPIKYYMRFYSLTPKAEKAYIEYDIPPHIRMEEMSVFLPPRKRVMRVSFDRSASARSLAPSSPILLSTHRNLCSNPQYIS